MLNFLRQMWHKGGDLMDDATQDHEFVTTSTGRKIYIRSVTNPNVPTPFVEVCDAFTPSETLSPAPEPEPAPVITKPQTDDSLPDKGFNHFQL